MEKTNKSEAETLHQKAEELLKKKSLKTDSQLSETDILRLNRKLQVHQIELEMQNEELRQAYETAEAALKKYTLMYDFAPIGYFTLDSEGSIHELNFTGADMLGDRRFSLVNSNFKLFVSDDSKPVFINFFSKVYTSNSKESCEVMLSYDGNPLCSVYIEGIVIDDEDHKCLLSVIDISDFKKQGIT